MKFYRDFFLPISIFVATSSLCYHEVSSAWLIMPIPFVTWSTMIWIEFFLVYEHPDPEKLEDLLYYWRPTLSLITYMTWFNLIAQVGNFSLWATRVYTGIGLLFGTIPLVLF